jgi:xylulokinase
MMGALPVDREGNPLRNSLIWADMRASKEEAFLRSQISMWDHYRITGHRISGSYGGPKMMWLKNNEPELYQTTYKFLNAKDYIILKLTGNFVTEYTDASSTNLWDQRANRWSDTVVGLAGLDMAKLPDALPSTAIAGTVTPQAAAQTGLLAGTPVVCGGGDGVCSAIGTGCIRPGIAHSCMGTSSWIALTDEKPLEDPSMKNNTWPHIVPGYYLPFGTMQCGGGAYNWAIGQLYAHEVDQRVGGSKFAVPTQEASASPLGAKGLLFLPYLIGERSPRWNPQAKGVFAGLTLEHNRGDMLRAVMEGVAFNLGVILKSMQGCGCLIDNLVVVGGGAKNELWRQIFADVYGVKIVKPRNTDEATSMGAAVTGGVGVGLFDSFDVIDRFNQIEAEALPSKENHAEYQKRLALFDECYERMVPLFDRL